MKGSNELQLNEATMVEIIQEWWDSRTKDLRKQYVRSVKYDYPPSGGGGAIGGVFVVSLESEGE